MSPLTVTAWPEHPDPRSAQFSAVGYDFGMVPPNKFRMVTVGALPPFDVLNDGVLIEVVSDDSHNTQYQDASGIYRLAKVGFDPPIDEVQPRTIESTCSILHPSEPIYSGTILQLYPPGIQVFVITPFPFTSPPNKIPNPITFNPQNYLAEP